MKNLKILTLTLLFVSVSFAQYNPNAEYWITYQYTPKKGMTAKFESAVKAKTKIQKVEPESQSKDIESQ